MTLSKFRSFDIYIEGFSVKKKEPTPKNNSIKNDKELEEERDKLRKAKIITEDSLLDRMTF